jgi:CheY-like chemotaxis protein
MNLAINASESMPDGGDLKVASSIVRLDEDYCKAHLEAKPGDYVMLSVKDAGRGMNEETKRCIFDPFFSTKQRGATRGTGLGLSVVRGTAQQRGGHITCESEPGKGTEFKVYFPAIDSKDQPVEPKMILVVEDNDRVAELEKRALESCGYKVIVATNGKQAIDIFQARKNEISLVLLDLILPEKTGRDCLMEMLTIDPSVKVLIASGYSVEGTLKEEITPLVKGFVRKPFVITDLISAVQCELGNA